MKRKQISAQGAKHLHNRYLEIKKELLEIEQDLEHNDYFIKNDELIKDGYVFVEIYPSCSYNGKMSGDCYYDIELTFVEIPGGISSMSLPQLIKSYGEGIDNYTYDEFKQYLEKGDFSDWSEPVSEIFLIEEYEIDDANPIWVRLNQLIPNFEDCNDLLLEAFSKLESIPSIQCYKSSEYSKIDGIPFGNYSECSNEYDIVQEYV